MRHSLRALVRSVALLAIAAFAIACGDNGGVSLSPPSVEIESFTLISERALAPTVTESTYRARCRTDAGPFDDAVAFVSAPDLPIDLVDATLRCGRLAASATVTSVDTIVLHRDPARPFDPSALDWITLAWGPGTLVASTTEASGARRLRYELEFTNGTGKLQSVAAGVTSAAAATTVLDGLVVASAQRNGAVRTNDAFEVRVANGAALDPAAVIWTLSVGARSAFALGASRTLDGFGQPLGDVAVEERGPAGLALRSSEPISGLATLAEQAGVFQWRFEKIGHLPVWREGTLAAGEVLFVPSPWLARRSEERVVLSVLNDVVLGDGNPIVVRFAGGAFATPGEGTLTAIQAQSLPGLLPAGWSPLAAFWLEVSAPPRTPGNAELRLADRLAPGERAFLIRFDEATQRWIETGVPVAVSGDTATTSIATAGAYAIVVPDIGATAPPPPIAGQPLPPTNTPFPLPDGLTAQGSVVPPVAAASVDPVQITAQAEVIVSHPGSLPSGLVLRSDIDERYDLRDGTSRTAPSYETFFAAYQRPGDDDAHTLHARFPLRPQVAVSSDELDEAVVNLEILPVSAFEGGFFDALGGRVGTPGVLVTAPAGAVTSPRAVELRGVDATQFGDLAPPGSLLLAFELAADGLVAGARLALGFGPQEPDAQFVVARFVNSGGRSGLEPRERFASDAGGVLRSAEPTQGARLPGVTGSGLYVLVRVGGPQGLVQGVARNSAGAAVAGLAVSITGQPWLTFSQAGGAFQLVAPIGNAEVVVTNLIGGDRGSESVLLASAASVGIVDIGTQPSGPRVVELDPANAATGVKASSPIRVVFSESIAVLAPGDLVLLDATGNEVPATLSTNLARSEATLLPIDPLASGALHTLTLADTIADASGLPLEGARTFTFTTQSVAARGAGAELISWEPGAQTSECDGVPGFDAADATISCVVGGAGTADPNAGVVLVNETRGTTATVLSGPDGAFRNFIDADVDDFIAATFINGNGTRIRIPLSRQLFDDGSVALFQGGGILEAESDGGPVQILIEPGTIKNKNKFKIEPLDAAALLELIQAHPPEDAQLLAGAMRFTVEGEAPEGEANLSFPVDPATLDLPADVAPERGAFAAAVVRDQADGSKVYEIVDKLRFEDGKIASNTFPFLLLKFLFGALDGGDIFSAIIVPMFLGADPVTVTGRVLECPGQQCLGLDLIAGLQVGRPLAGALVSLRTPSKGATLRAALDPGMLFATSGPDGRYALVAPSLAAGYVLTASHPKHSQPVSEPVIGILDFSISGAIEKNLIFAAPFPGSINGPVRVNAAHTPVNPAPGQPARLQVNASHGAGAPNVSIALDHVEALVAGVPVGAEDVTIGPEILGPPSATRKRVSVDVSATPGKSLVAYIRVHASASTTNPEVTVPPKDILHPIAFGVGPAQVPNQVTPSDDNDGIGPVVVNTIPADGAVAVSPGEPIALVFNEPIDASVEEEPGAIAILGADGGSVPFSLELSADQRVLLVRPGPLSSGTDYTLTASTAIRDVRTNGQGNELDQDPGESGSQGFTLHFRTAAAAVNALPGIESGGGAVLGRGAYSFALARSPSPALVVFDVSYPTAPVEVNRVGLPGFPRDLVFIPHYSFKTRADQPTRTHDLLVAVGGDLGSDSIDDDGNLFTPVQFAAVFDVENPLSPAQIGFANLTRRIGTVTRVEWRPPLLVYLEAGADAQFVSSALLQELILGTNLTTEEITALPLFGVREIDGNGDGDFVDAGSENVPADRLPLPNPSVEYFGKRASCLVDETNQRVLDFEFDGVSFCGVTLSAGNLRTVSGNLGPAVPPQYRTVLAEGQPIDRVQGSLSFGAGARPKRLAVLFNVRLDIAGGTEARNLALVSLSPDDGGVPALAVIDVTLPAAPTLLVKIPFSDALGLGQLQSVSERSDGVLALATTTSIVLLDPTKLALPLPTDSGALHASVSGVIREAGSGAMSFDGNSAGVNVVSLGGRNQVVLSAPRLHFVAFGGDGPLVDPTALVDHPADIETEFARMRQVASLAPARLGGQGGATPTLDPPSRTVHYHVLLDLPGGAGDEVEIVLESLNRAGTALSNKGRDFPPVRAAADATLTNLGQQAREDCDATINRFVAKRLSSDKKSNDYNRYLSIPFALTYERIAADRLDELRQEPKREILWSGHFLRASIDPAETADPVLAPFVSLVDGFEKKIRPGTSVTARSLEALYVMGPNPPPPSGAIDAPGSIGMVNAANGEIRMQNVDLVLPSRRMPITFQRSIGGQDLHEGVFGRGWDFNYAQRIVPLEGDVFPDGQVMPLVERSTAQTSNRARSRDVLWQTGTGRVVHFRHAGASPPAEIQTDPLLTEEGWLDASDYYLPEPGIFDVLLRFSDGNFLRVTPEGMQFWYSASGRLERIYHRYESNQHVLRYNERDEVVRVDDESVGDERFVRIGYWRFASDPSFDGDIDRETENAFIAGKVARLLDSAERDVLFNYNEDGQLVSREGFLLDDADGGPPRPLLSYVSDGECAGNLRGVVGAESGGTSTLVASLDDGATQPTAESASGAAGSFSIAVSGDNDASTMASATTTATRPDGSTVEFHFDELGQPTEIKSSGVGGDAVSKPKYDALGRLERVEFPEGNAIEYAYDAPGTVPLRSLPNPREVKRLVGPRAGSDTTETLRYDGFYNLRSGANQDVDGNSINYQLTSDLKDVAAIDYAGDGVRSYAFNDHGQLLSDTSPEGVVRSMTYDVNSGFKLSESLGADMTTFDYDGSIGGLLGMPTTISPLDGATPSLIEYDARLLPLEVDRGGRFMRFRYDALGNPVRIERETGDGVLVETRDYDDVGFLETVNVENVSTGDAQATSTTTFIPDDEYRVKEIHYPNGAVKTFTYDHQGQLLGMTFGGYTAEYTLDKHGNVTEIAEGGETTQTFVYDGHDRMQQMTRKVDGGDAVYDYTRFDSGGVESLKVTDPSFDIVQESVVTAIDALGRVRVVERKADDTGSDSTTYTPASTGSGGSITAAGPFETTTSTYDAAGRATTASDGSRTVTWQRDGNGKVEGVTSSEDGVDYTIGFDYDELDNLLSLDDALGRVETYTPRLDGAATQVTDAQNGVRQQRFSQLGELLGRVLPGSLGGVKYRYDDSRRRTHVLDLEDKGEVFAFDPDFPFALKSRTRRNGSVISVDGRDLRGNALTSTIPGGSVTSTYDLQGRQLTNTVSYSDGPGFATEFEYDAVERVRVARYGEGTADKSTSYDYDKLGPLVGVSVQEDGESYDIDYGIRADGVRTSITYPSGLVVIEGRDAGGRLISLSDGAPLWLAQTFFGREQPGDATLGTALLERRSYDPRGRLVTVRTEGPGAIGLLAELRYVYDANDNPLVRQQVHRAGRADFFEYDAADRLTRADFDARPDAGSQEPRPLGGFVAPVPGFLPGRYARSYGYDAVGLDVMTGGAAENPDALDLPPFAAVIEQHDDLLHPGLVDGSLRSTDSLGNTAEARLFVREAGTPAPVSRGAEITHDGASHLVRVSRDDGVIVEYDYRHDGMFHRRRVVRDGNVVSERAYAWDGPRLLEERELVDGVGLVGRYFYRESDAPFAADLLVGGSIQRFFYLRDAQSSVVAVADDGGNVRERVGYDAFGQPSIERGDTAAPRIKRVVATADGMRVEFSEPVLPPADTTASAQIATSPGLGNVFEVSRAGSIVPVTVSLEESVPGSPFGTVLRVRFLHVAASSLSLRLLAGSIVDESGNRVAEEIVGFVDLATPDAELFAQSPAPQTAPVRLARSELGSPFLFHGQWFDYDTGLLFLRARFLDVAAGVFLELDPAGYGPSTNLYAGIGNNPSGKRDPTGAWPFRSLQFIDEAVQVAEEGGKVLVRNISGAGHYADDGAEVAAAGGYLQQARAEAARLARARTRTRRSTSKRSSTRSTTHRAPSIPRCSRARCPRAPSRRPSACRAPSREPVRGTLREPHPVSARPRSTMQSSPWTTSRRRSRSIRRHSSMTRSKTSISSSIRSRMFARWSRLLRPAKTSSRSSTARSGTETSNARTASTRPRGRSSCRVIALPRRTRSITIPIALRVSPARCWRHASRATCSTRSSRSSSGPTAASTRTSRAVPPRSPSARRT